MTDRDNLREHLKYYRDLAVAGITRADREPVSIEATA